MTGLWIDGKQAPSASGRVFASTAPADGRFLGEVPRADGEDVERAAQAAQKGFVRWSALAPAERERVLLRAADLLEAQTDRLLDLIIDESGSTISKARFECHYGASLLRAAAGEARRLYGDTFPNDRPHRVSMVFREPLGVVVAISPFNAPLALLAKMVVFPLAAGNAVISKPSEETSLIALEFARILHEAGLPDSALNMLTGYGGEVGALLVGHPAVRGIAFTGSTSTGQKIGRLAMQNMTRLQLELGGKNPLIVLRDVDVEQAVKATIQGAFYHGGQICMSSSRIIVERPVADAYIAALTEAVGNLYLGDLRDERTAYGTLIHQGALDKVMRHVEIAQRAGASLLTGGAVHQGLTYQPTLILEPPRDNEIWREETFGPVACIVVVDSLDEAIETANQSDYGLSAGILTNDMRRGLIAARRIRCGGVHLGLHSFQSDSLAPVGGFGLSGMGRSGGKYSTEHFTELKWISIELGD